METGTDRASLLSRPNIHSTKRKHNMEKRDFESLYRYYDLHDFVLLAFKKCIEIFFKIK